MIILNDVTKKYDNVVAVSELSFKIGKGEIVGLIGSNGAGKSTLMRMITGFLKPTHGTVSVSGISVENNPLVVQKLIGYLPENAPIYQSMTPLEFLSFIVDIRGYKGIEAKQALERVVAMTGLEKVLRRSISTLSKGYKQRVCFAQALVHDPPILILDEPTDGLDPNQKYEIRKIIQEMAKNKIVLFSTHILEEMNAICSRVIIIHEGKKVIDTIPTALQETSKRHNLVSILLNTQPTETILKELESASFVSHYEVQEEDKGHRVFVFPEGGKNILYEVNTIFTDMKNSIIEFDLEKGQIEEVFRALTLGHEQNTTTEEAKI